MGGLIGFNETTFTSRFSLVISNPDNATEAGTYFMSGGNVTQHDDAFLLLVFCGDRFIIQMYHELNYTSLGHRKSIDGGKNWSKWEVI